MKLLITIGVTFVITLVITLGIVFFFFSGHGKPEETVVRLEKPVSGDLVEFIQAPGLIEPETKVMIRSRISAQITQLPFQEGDRVTKGDPDADPPVPPSLLLQLDDSDLKAALRSAEANFSAQQSQVEVARTRIDIQQSTIAGVQVSLDQATKELVRFQKLLETGDISQSELDLKQTRVDELKTQFASAQKNLQSAKLGLTIAQHNLEAAKANVTRATESLRYTTIYSPIDGVVTQLNSEVGEMATGSLYNPGNVILQVADLSRMLVNAEVDETDICHVARGQKARIHVQAWPGMDFPGRVLTTALAHSFGGQGTKYYKVEILMDQLDKRILSGLTADVDIEIRHHRDIFKVPTQAVLSRPVEGLPPEIRDKNPNVQKKKTLTNVVYRMVDGEAIVTPVTIGESDETHTLIAAGVSADDLIVVGPFKALEGLKHKAKLKDEKVAEAEKKAAEKKAKDKQAGDDKKDAGDNKAGEDK